MPVVTETTVPGYVSCRNPRCEGYKERETEVVKRVQAFRYIEDLKGDIPGVEREAVDIVHDGTPCPACGGPQVFSDEPRPEYAQMSGQDQLALLNMNQSGQIRDAQMAQLKADKELAEMRAKQAETDALLREMHEELKRRRGGRPPKDDPAT